MADIEEEEAYRNSTELGYSSAGGSDSSYDESETNEDSEGSQSLKGASVDTAAAKVRPKRKRKQKKEVPPTKPQRLFMRTKFLRIGSAQNVCLYCTQVIGNDHTSRSIFYFYIFYRLDGPLIDSID